MHAKLASALCRADLGKKVKLEFGESVLVGKLEHVAHFLDNATYVTIAGTQQVVSDPEATISFV